MKLTEAQKNNIKLIDKDIFRKSQYSGLTDKTRDDLGQVYTPADICIKMIESFDVESLEGLKIIDPTCGSGNLLISCLMAGADPHNIYGNEYNETAVKLCRRRLKIACDLLNLPDVPRENIHQGNATQKKCLTDFSKTYLRNYNVEGIDDPQYAQDEELSRWEENKALTKRIIRNIKRKKKSR